MDTNEEQDYSKPFSLKAWKCMVPFVKPCTKKIIVVTILMIFCALVDTLNTIYQKYIIDEYVAKGRMDGIIPVIAVGVVAAALLAVTVYLFINLSMQVELQFAENLRTHNFKHLQTLSLPYFNNTPVGSTLARLMSDTDKITSMVAWGIVDSVWNIAYVLFAVTAMFILSWRLALIIVAIMPIIIIITNWFQKRMLKVNRKVRENNSKITAAFNEGISGARTSKTLVLENTLSEEFGGLTESMRHSSVRANALSAAFVPIIMMLGSLAVSIVLARGGKMAYMDTLGKIEIGTLVALVSFASGIFDPIRTLARLFSNIIATQANVERVEKLLNEKPIVVDSPKVIERYGDNFHPKRENWEPLHGDILFKDITFKYPDGDTNVLENFNLNVPAGSTIAIVGETGAGKSTLVNLVCRFYEPTSGEILIDGRDYRERSQLWLHSNIGYVLQSPHLFSGSIRENIKYGDESASDEQIMEAAKLVSADKVIEKLPDGLDSEVGEGGDKLSTGEKQLISFARAVLVNPQVFVLDEATSSIDTDTELLIQDAISRILKGRTSFIIAHRLSTIKMADLILVVRDGKIIEQGSHSELLEQEGYYNQLYTMQYEKS